MSRLPADHSGEHRCARCAHWRDDRASLERALPGLASFGSAYGASVGASRLCAQHDRLVMPRDGCAKFVRRANAPHALQNTRP